MGSASSPLPQTDRHPDRMAGHWLLARLGKRVLRPGGLALTRRMLDALDLAGRDVLELAPGLGRTAREVVARRPASYRGVDADATAAEAVNRALGLPGAVVHARAESTGLPRASADVVLGEAMLTMQSDAVKRAIIGEAFRLLRPGGRYAIHEMGLMPDDIEQTVRRDLERSLAQSLRVNARPLTFAEWGTLLEDAGFLVQERLSAPMRLLQPGRIVADEGPLGALRFFGNLLRQPDARRRVLGMRSTFARHRRSLMAVALVAVKPLP